MNRTSKIEYLKKFNKIKKERINKEAQLMLDPTNLGLFLMGGLTLGMLLGRASHIFLTKYLSKKISKELKEIVSATRLTSKLTSEKETPYVEKSITEAGEERGIRSKLLEDLAENFGVMKQSAYQIPGITELGNLILRITYPFGIWTSRIFGAVAFLTLFSFGFKLGKYLFFKEDSGPDSILTDKEREDISYKIQSTSLMMNQEFKKFNELSAQKAFLDYLIKTEKNPSKVLEKFMKETNFLEKTISESSLENNSRKFRKIKKLEEEEEGKQIEGVAERFMESLGEEVGDKEVKSASYINKYAQEEENVMWKTFKETARFFDKELGFEEASKAIFGEDRKSVGDWYSTILNSISNFFSDAKTFFLSVGTTFLGYLGSLAQPAASFFKLLFSIGMGFVLSSLFVYSFRYINNFVDGVKSALKEYSVLRNLRESFKKAVEDTRSYDVINIGQPNYDVLKFKALESLGSLEEESKRQVLRRGIV